jgi:hypothetical protein
MMSRTALAVAIAIGTSAVGCQSNPPQTAGFLSDYSRLEPSGNDLRYVDLVALANYTQFIVEPIQVFFYEEADMDSIDEEELARLSNYMETAIRTALGDRYEIVSEPAPGVAHLRVALTDLDRSGDVLRVIPSAMLANFGTGGTSMEAELTDSVADEQIVAIVEAQEAGGFALADLRNSQGAEAVIDGWAAALRARLDEAHQD